jgi:sulfoacetaldehyde acetyltransferase
MRTIAKADVVVALGSRLGPFGTLPQYDMAYWPDNAKIIQVDVNLAVLGLSKRVDIASCGDVKAVAAELLERIKSLRPNLGPIRRDWMKLPAKNAPGPMNWLNGLPPPVS